MKQRIVIALLAATFTAFAAQATAQSTYSSRDSLRAQEVIFGNVIQAKPEKIKQESDGRYTAAGTAAGGIVGAAVGTQGKSNNYTGGAIGGVIGGLIGGVGAEMIQRRELDGQNILVKLDDGRTLFVLMPVLGGQFFRPGQRVAVASVNGQQRIIDTPAAQDRGEAAPAQVPTRAVQTQYLARNDQRQVEQEVRDLLGPDPAATPKPRTAAPKQAASEPKAAAPAPAPAEAATPAPAPVAKPTLPTAAPTQAAQAPAPAARPTLPTAAPVEQEGALKRLVGKIF